jgi:hypothetical protein
MKSLNLPGAAAPVIRSLTIEGKPFELSVRQQVGGDWHWLITAPGHIVLSGAAPSEMQALDSACRTGKALARLIAA